MTQPEHPFKDLPEAWSVDCFKFRSSDDDHGEGRWVLSTKQGAKCYVSEPGWTYGAWKARCGLLIAYGPTPDAAFQALRQAVRELANDLGVK